MNELTPYPGQVVRPLYFCSFASADIQSGAVHPHFSLTRAFYLFSAPVEPYADERKHLDAFVSGCTQSVDIRDSQLIGSFHYISPDDGSCGLIWTQPQRDALFPPARSRN